MKDIVQLMSSDETLLALAGRVQIRSQLELSIVSIPHPPAAPAGSCPVMAISSDIFPHRVNYWSYSHVLYQLPPPAGHLQCF